MSERPISPNPDRYKVVDERNRESWYLTEVDRPFSVYMSVQGAGAQRTLYNRFEDDPAVAAALKINNEAGRYILGGNMSTVASPDGTQYGPETMTNEERIQDARNNMNRFIDSVGVDPAQIRVLNPERDYTHGLTVVNADTDTASYNGEEPARLEERGDFVYTYNPNRVLAVRPADCPVVVLSGDTPKGRMNALIHFAWQGAAHDQLADMDQILASMELDRSSARAYITPGGHAETYDHSGTPKHPNDRFPVTEGLLHNIRTSDAQGELKYGFDVDTPQFVYEGMLGMGFNEKQLFMDTSDTTAPESGYASHSRATKLGEGNTRDLVIATFEPGPSLVASNPERPLPPEIAWQIVPLTVSFRDFDGTEHEGTIEVHRDLAEDVQDFFTLAQEIGFPIEKVKKSSDAPTPWDDGTLMAENATSSFNYRMIAGTDRPSLHGLGRALDVNPRLNPYIRYDDEGNATVEPAGAEHHPGEPGVFDAEHPLVVFMKSRGWEWGGDWKPESGRTDLHHFQKAPEA